MDHVLRNKRRHDASSSLSKVLATLAAMSTVVASLVALIEDLTGTRTAETPAPLWIVGVPIIATLAATALMATLLILKRKSDKPSF